jgi:hypothetical protein
MKKYSIMLLVYFTAVSHLYAQTQADSVFYNTKQSQWLREKTGSWKVTMTLQPFKNTSPQIVHDLEAERTMIGALCMHEIMVPTRNSEPPLFERVSDLDYNKNDERWDYMTIDTRITGGIMYFTNFSQTIDSIVSYILNFPHPGFGPELKDRGKNVKIRNVIITVSPDHDIVKQYWKLTDSQEWLAVQYEYFRNK